MSNYLSCSGFGVSYKIYRVGFCVFSLHYHFWFLFFCFGFFVSVFYWQSYYCFSFKQFSAFSLGIGRVLILALSTFANNDMATRVTLKPEARDCSQPTSSSLLKGLVLQSTCISSLWYTWDTLFIYNLYFFPSFVRVTQIFIFFPCQLSLKQLFKRFIFVMHDFVFLLCVCVGGGGGGWLRGTGVGGMEKACFSWGSDRFGSCNFY